MPPPPALPPPSSDENASRLLGCSAVPNPSLPSAKNIADFFSRLATRVGCPSAMSLAEALPLWPADAELSEEHHRRGPLNHRRQIERCFHELAPDLRRLAYARLGSWHEAEDVVQETFCRALSRPALDTGRPLWPWLATVAHNLCNDILSDRRRLEPS